MAGERQRPRESRLWLHELIRVLDRAVRDPRRRTGVAVGRVRARHTVPKVLCGLRAGTCHLVCELDDQRAGVLIGRLGPSPLAWHAEVPEAFLPSTDEAWRAGAWHGPLGLHSGELHVEIDRCYVDDDDLVIHEGVGSGWTRGHAGDIRLGEPGVKSNWIVLLEGQGLAEHSFELDGHRLALRSATRRHGPRIELQTATPVEALDAAAIVYDVLPLLRLTTAVQLEVVATWSSDETTGVASFDSRLRSLRHELIPETGTRAFLDAAVARLSELTADERKVLQVLIDMLMVACEPDLETSIAMASSALELASEEWLPKSASHHEVEKPARDAIRQAFVDAAAAHAAGTEFASDAKDVAQHLFQRPAKVRFRALLAHLGIPSDDDGVVQFVKMRNKVVHGGFQKRPVDERIRALLFGRWMLSNCIARYLGYTGRITDWRNLETR